tara:strand:+ start:1315 stop:2757 length:1443 start_codon:yes stop_codon:yes gene_type:complete
MLNIFFYLLVFLSIGLYSDEYVFQKNIDPFTDETKIHVQLKNTTGDWIKIACEPEPALYIFSNEDIKGDLNILSLGIGDLGSDMVYRFDKKDKWGLTVYFEDTKYDDIDRYRYEPKVARLDQFPNEPNPFWLNERIEDIAQDLSTMNTLIMKHNESDRIFSFKNPKNKAALKQFFTEAENLGCPIRTIEKESQQLKKIKDEFIKKQVEKNRKEEIQEKIRLAEQAKIEQREKEFKADLIKLITNHYDIYLGKMYILGTDLKWKVGVRGPGKYVIQEDGNKQFVPDKTFNLNMEVEHDHYMSRKENGSKYIDISTEIDIPVNGDIKTISKWRYGGENTIDIWSGDLVKLFKTNENGFSTPEYEAVKKKFARRKFDASRMNISTKDASTYISAMTLRVRFNGFNLSPEFIKYADNFYQTYNDNELKRYYEFESCEELWCSDDIMIHTAFGGPEVLIRIDPWDISEWGTFEIKPEDINFDVFE